jgi:disulfide bond formation protein DsbB
VSTEQFSRFVAVLSLLCWAGTLAVVSLLVLRRRVAGAARALESLRDAALWLGAVVAVGCTAGSLYLSQVAGFVPCDLCWYQRICMYPLAVTMLIAAIRRDARVWIYAVVPAGVGAVIATYHAQLQAFPAQHSFCPTTVPCTIRYVWEFGFVSIPFMALAGFAAILTMLRVANLGAPTVEELT